MLRARDVPTASPARYRGGIALDTATLLRTLIAVVLLLAITIAVLVVVRAPRPLAPFVALGRGILQLAILSVVLSGVITDPRWVALALLVMLVVAIVTATRRVGWSRRHLLIETVAIAAGVVVAASVVFGTGALEFSTRYALAIGGIVIGNAMTIASIGGRRLREATIDRWDEVEGWLALGATPRRSTRDISRTAMSAALIPTLDQTRTTGLVTLPGAFVGAIFGGLSPIAAGRFQILVLASILAAGAVTVALSTWMLSAATQKPVAPGE